MQSILIQFITILLAISFIFYLYFLSPYWISKTIALAANWLWHSLYYNFIFAFYLSIQVLIKIWLSLFVLSYYVLTLFIKLLKRVGWKPNSYIFLDELDFYYFQIAERILLFEKRLRKAYKNWVHWINPQINTHGTKKEYKIETSFLTGYLLRYLCIYLYCFYLRIRQIVVRTLAGLLTAEVLITCWFFVHVAVRSINNFIGKRIWNIYAFSLRQFYYLATAQISYHFATWIRWYPTIWRTKGNLDEKDTPDHLYMHNYPSAHLNKLYELVNWNIKLGGRAIEKFTLNSTPKTQFTSILLIILLLPLLLLCLIILVPFLIASWGVMGLVEYLSNKEYQYLLHLSANFEKIPLWIRLGGWIGWLTSFNKKINENIVLLPYLLFLSFYWLTTKTIKIPGYLLIITFKVINLIWQMRLIALGVAIYWFWSEQLSGLWVISLWNTVWELLYPNVFLNLFINKIEWGGTTFYIETRDWSRTAYGASNTKWGFERIWKDWLIQQITLVEKRLYNFKVDRMAWDVVKDDFGPWLYYRKIVGRLWLTLPFKVIIWESYGAFLKSMHAYWIVYGYYNRFYAFCLGLAFTKHFFIIWPLRFLFKLLLALPTPIRIGSHWIMMLLLNSVIQLVFMFKLVIINILAIIKQLLFGIIRIILLSLQLIKWLYNYSFYAIILRYYCLDQIIYNYYSWTMWYIKITVLVDFFILDIKELWEDIDEFILNNFTLISNIQLDGLFNCWFRGISEDEVLPKEEEPPYEAEIPEVRYAVMKYLFALLLRVVLWIDTVYLNIELPKTYEHHLIPWGYDKYVFNFLFRWAVPSRRRAFMTHWSWSHYTVDMFTLLRQWDMHAKNVTVYQQMLEQEAWNESGKAINYTDRQVVAARLTRGMMYIGVVVYYVSLLLLLLFSKGYTALTIQERAMEMNRQAAWTLFRQQKPVELPWLWFNHETVARLEKKIAITDQEQDKRELYPLLFNKVLELDKKNYTTKATNELIALSMVGENWSVDDNSFSPVFFDLYLGRDNQLLRRTVQLGTDKVILFMAYGFSRNELLKKSWGYPTIDTYVAIHPEYTISKKVVLEQADFGHRLSDFYLKTDLLLTNGKLGNWLWAKDLPNLMTIHTPEKRLSPDIYEYEEGTAPSLNNAPWSTVVWFLVIPVTIFLKAYVYLGGWGLHPTNLHSPLWWTPFNDLLRTLYYHFVFFHYISYYYSLYQPMFKRPGQHSGNAIFEFYRMTERRSYHQYFYAPQISYHGGVKGSIKYFDYMYSTDQSDSCVEEVEWVLTITKLLVILMLITVNKKITKNAIIPLKQKVKVSTRWFKLIKKTKKMYLWFWK